MITFVLCLSKLDFSIANKLLINSNLYILRFFSFFGAIFALLPSVNDIRGFVSCSGNRLSQILEKSNGLKID